MPLHSRRVDDAVLVTQTSLKVAPQNEQVKNLLETLKSYRRQQGSAAGVTNTPARTQSNFRYGTFTLAQVQARAVELANQKAQALYNCQPFQEGRLPKLVEGYWVWHDRRAHGTGDIEATVKSAADGTEPDVKVTLLDGHGITR